VLAGALINDGGSVAYDGGSMTEHGPAAAANIALICDYRRAAESTSRAS